MFPLASRYRHLLSPLISLVDESPMEAETTALHGFDLSPAFRSNIDQDLDLPLREGHFPQEEIVPAAAVALADQDQSVEAMFSKANPCAAPSISAEHQMDSFAEVVSPEKCGTATVYEASKDVEGSAEAPHPLTEELNVAAGARQEGIEIEPAVGGLSVDRSECKAATKLQKVYRSYRTRRRLADSAIVAEELWWQALDFARLNHSTVSFFNYTKPETAISRWYRASINASKVGQGLSKDGKALKLAFQHWIEAIDPRHRYGHNLHFYYEKWCESEGGQPFFYWLDLGEGRNVELEECPRSLLRQQCIKYMGPQEREHYEYMHFEGRIMHKRSGDLLDTTKGPEGTKWIFVMSTSRRLYAGMKKKGMFQHSSFLAGGSTLAAGRFIAENGKLKAIWAYSGHYKPSDDNLKQFLNYLRENGVDLNEIQIRSSDNEDEYNDTKPQAAEKSLDALPASKLPALQIPARQVVQAQEQPVESINTESEENGKMIGGKAYKRTFSGGLQSPKAEVSERAIQERIKSKMESSSYQLGHQLSSKWCSGSGPRIGCVADYPVELRLQALEFTNLSPRRPPTSHSHQLSSVQSLSPSEIRRFALCTSPSL